MQLGFGNPRVLLASGVVGRERRFWFLDDLRRNWEQEGVMFTPQGKGWTGWSTPTAANQRSGGGAPAASAPLGKGKGRIAELQQEVLLNHYLFLQSFIFCVNLI